MHWAESCKTIHERIGRSHHTLGIAVDTNAFTVGADNDLNISVSGSDVTIKNTPDGDLILGVNDGGVAQAGITVDGATGEVLVLADPNTKLRCCKSPC